MVVVRLPWLILVAGSMGCASIQPLRDPARFIAESSPDVVYVTHNNGALLTITHPRVSGDSLLGTWEAVSQPLALPLSHLQRVAANRRDKTRTTLAIAGISMVTVAMSYLLTRDVASIRQPCNFEGATQFQGCDNPR
ncbi:MAG TPA: hypothetical protein VGA20_02625 [Gemmatimonadales bacterium]